MPVLRKAPNVGDKLKETQTLNRTMKNILLLGFVFFTASVSGQTSVSDTILKVVYTDTSGNSHKPAYFFNGKFTNQTLIATLNPMVIESIDVVKENIQFDNVKYYGQIHIKTKNTYKAKIISLTQLKEKYTNLKNKQSIFMIDGTIVDGNYDSSFVDENYLLKIIVDKVENSQENLHLGLIRLFTKSDENIKKSKEIRIRGGQLTMSR